MNATVERRDDFEACYMRANEVGILYRGDDGEYTSLFTKVAWALWQEQAQALRDKESEIARLNAAWNSAHRQAMENGQAAKKAEAMLRSEVALLRAWARESREGGWSTHQVDPMNRRADEIAAHLGDEHE